VERACGKYQTRAEAAQVGATERWRADLAAADMLAESLQQRHSAVLAHALEHARHDLAAVGDLHGVRQLPLGKGRGGCQVAVADRMVASGMAARRAWLAGRTDFGHRTRSLSPPRPHPCRPHRQRVGDHERAHLHSHQYAIPG
jgi:hypothetical protein